MKKAFRRRMPLCDYLLPAKTGGYRASRYPKLSFHSPRVAQPAGAMDLRRQRNAGGATTHAGTENPEVESGDFRTANLGRSKRS